MKTVKQFVIRNKFAFGAAVLIFLIGTVAGSVFSCRLSASETDELREYIKPYLSENIVSSVEPGKIFSADAANHLRFVLAAAACAFSVYLLPVFALLLAAKGYQFGFAMGFISANFGSRGIALAVTSTLVSYLLAIPLYFLIFVVLFNHVLLIKNTEYMNRADRRREYLSYFIFIIIAYSLLCLTGVIGAFVTPLAVGVMN